MKILKLLVGSLIINLIFTVSAFAQVEKTHSNTLKVVLINPNAFKDEKTGIKEIVEVYKQLEVEFADKNEEFKLRHNEFLKLRNELEQISKAIEPPKSITKEYIDSKINEFEKFNSKYQSKQQEAKILYEKRESELLLEINKKIVIAFEQFAKGKDYVILDFSKMGDSMFSYDTPDATNEFIKFYNESFDKTKSQ